MMLPLMPDVDALVLGALRAGMPGASVAVLWPMAPTLPLVVAHRVAGGEKVDPRGLDSGNVDVQCTATTRAAASLLARQAKRALIAAARSQYRGPDGYLVHAELISGPYEVRGADSTPDEFTFQCTFGVRVRPLPEE